MFVTLKKKHPNRKLPRNVLRVLRPFQLQTASIRERPLRATLAIITAPTLPAAAVRELTLLIVTERGLCSVSIRA